MIGRQIREGLLIVAVKLARLITGVSASRKRDPLSLTAVALSLTPRAARLIRLAAPAIGSMSPLCPSTSPS